MTPETTQFRRAVRPGVELRLFDLADGPALLKLAQSDREHLSFGLPMFEKWHHLDDVYKTLGEWLAEKERVGSHYVAIWVEDELAGCVSLEIVNKEDSIAAIGFFLGERFQGRGLATQSGAVMLDWAFEEMKMHRVLARCATFNVRSRAVLERLDFVYEGTLRETLRIRGDYVDLASYGILAREWAARKRSHEDDGP